MDQINFMIYKNLKKNKKLKVLKILGKFQKKKK